MPQLRVLRALCGLKNTSACSPAVQTGRTFIFSEKVVRDVAIAITYGNIAPGRRDPPSNPSAPSAPSAGCKTPAVSCYDFAKHFVPHPQGP